MGDASIFSLIVRFIILPVDPLGSGVVVKKILCVLGILNDANFPFKNLTISSDEQEDLSLNNINAPTSSPNLLSGIPNTAHSLTFGCE